MEIFCFIISFVHWKQQTTLTMGLPAQQPLQDDVKTLRKFVNHLPPTGDLQKFSLVLPTSHEVYHGGKPIVIVVYFLTLWPLKVIHI